MYLHAYFHQPAFSQKYDVIPQQFLKAGLYPGGKEWLEDVPLIFSATKKANDKVAEEHTPARRRPGRPRHCLPSHNPKQYSILQFCSPSLKENRHNRTNPLEEARSPDVSSNEAATSNEYHSNSDSRSVTDSNEGTTDIDGDKFERFNFQGAEMTPNDAANESSGSDSEEDLLQPKKRIKRLLNIDYSSSEEEAAIAMTSMGSSAKVCDDLQHNIEHDTTDFGGTTTEAEIDTNTMLTGDPDYLEDTADYNVHRTSDDEAVRSAIASFGGEGMDINGVTENEQCAKGKMTEVYFIMTFCNECYALFQKKVPIYMRKASTRNSIRMQVILAMIRTCNS